MYSKHLPDAANFISDQQTDSIIEAILQGQYSSACLLLLEAIGHDPLHYIPYRTYNRLQKQRLQKQRQQTDLNPSSTSTSVTVISAKISKNTAKKEVVADLDYIELLSEQTGPTGPVEGGQGLFESLLRNSKHQSTRKETKFIPTTIAIIKSCQIGTSPRTSADILNFVR